MEKFFEYRQEHDKNQAIFSKEDENIFDKFPVHIQREVYYNFLFKEFLSNFNRFFELPLQNERRKNKRRVTHAYYNWEHEEYSSFMIKTLK